MSYLIPQDYGNKKTPVKAGACYVPHCPSSFRFVNSKKRKPRNVRLKDEHHILFAVPVDSTLLKEWQKNVPKRQDHVLSYKHKICASHFKKRDIFYKPYVSVEDNESKIELHTKQFAYLRPGAVPVFFKSPDIPKYLRDRNRRSRKPPKERAPLAKVRKLSGDVEENMPFDDDEYEPQGIVTPPTSPVTFEAYKAEYANEFNDIQFIDSTPDDSTPPALTFFSSSAQEASEVSEESSVTAKEGVDPTPEEAACEVVAEPEDRVEIPKKRVTVQFPPLMPRNLKPIEAGALPPVVNSLDLEYIPEPEPEPCPGIEIPPSLPERRRNKVPKRNSPPVKPVSPLVPGGLKIATSTVIDLPENQSFGSDVNLEIAAPTRWELPDIGGPCRQSTIPIPPLAPLPGKTIPTLPIENLVVKPGEIPLGTTSCMLPRTFAEFVDMCDRVMLPSSLWTLQKDPDRCFAIFSYVRVHPSGALSEKKVIFNRSLKPEMWFDGVRRDVVIFDTIKTFGQVTQILRTLDKFVPCPGTNYPNEPYSAKCHVYKDPSAVRCMPCRSRVLALAAQAAKRKAKFTKPENARNLALLKNATKHKERLIMKKVNSTLLAYEQAVLEAITPAIDELTEPEIEDPANITEKDFENLVPIDKTLAFIEDKDSDLQDAAD